MLSQKLRSVNIYIDKADEMIYYLPVCFTTEVKNEKNTHNPGYIVRRQMLADRCTSYSFRDGSRVLLHTDGAFVDAYGRLHAILGDRLRRMTGGGIVET